MALSFEGTYVPTLAPIATPLVTTMVLHSFTGKTKVANISYNNWLLVSEPGILKVLGDVGRNSNLYEN